MKEVVIEVERKDRQFFPIVPESPSFLSANAFNRDGRPRYPISPGIGFTVLEECKDEFLELDSKTRSTFTHACTPYHVEEKGRKLVMVKPRQNSFDSSSRV